VNWTKLLIRLEICASGSAASFASIWAGRTYRPTQGTGLIRQLSHPKSLEADVDCEAGECPVRVKRRHRRAIRRSLLYPQEQTSSGRAAMFVSCQNRTLADLAQAGAPLRSKADQRPCFADQARCETASDGVARRQIRPCASYVSFRSSRSCAPRRGCTCSLPWR
jgi:hypothetical protein